MTQTTNPFHAPMSFNDPAARRTPAPYGDPAPFAGTAVYLDPARLDPHSRFAPKTLMVPSPPPSRSGRRAGATLGIVVAALSVLIGLAVLLVGLFGSTALDLSPVKDQIAATTKAVTGVAPTGLSCPTDVAPTAGAVFTCTGTLDGQPVRYTVTQTDDQGHVTFTSDTFVVVDAVAQKLGADMARKSGVGVGASCDAGGRKVIVGGRGTSFPCTVMNAQDPADRVVFTATITDDQGTVAFAVRP